MPKEKVFDSAGLFDLEVGWSSLGECVQVGLLVHDGRSIADWLTESSGDELPPGTRGGVPREAGEQMKLAQFTSLWSTLDRAQINRLIRMLRKARDDSYGRDE